MIENSSRELSLQKRNLIEHYWEYQSRIYSNKILSEQISQIEPVPN